MATKKKELQTSVGRRKTAVARVFLYDGKGEFLVNGVDIDAYFHSERAKLAWTEPFHILGISHPASKYNATIKVEGSGRTGQLGAVVHALSRVLAGMDDENRKLLRKASLLTRDPRMVERKKYYLKKARKAPQYSKR